MTEAEKGRLLDCSGRRVLLLEAVARAAHDLLNRSEKFEQLRGAVAALEAYDHSPDRMGYGGPLWPVISAEAAAAAELPTDLAEQHEHYRLGTPKR